MTCPKCGSEDLSAVGKCRPCWAAYMKAYYAANKDRMRAQKRAEVARRTPEQKARVAEMNAKWAAANPESRAAARAKWSANNPEADKQAKRDYGDRNRASINARKAETYRRDPVKHRAWVLANKDRQRRLQRKSHLKLRFGLTLEQFDAMLVEQDGRCAICGTDNPGTRTWHVDHDHATNVVRGLLCHGCNKGIGLLGEDPARLLSAERYIQKHRRARLAA